MLEIKNLSASYGGENILENVSFRLRPHTFTAVVGKNGCGKSTLVSCINQEMRYTGEILYSDTNLALMSGRERAKNIAVLPQMLKIPHVTVEELVMFGRSPYLDLAKRPSEGDLIAINAAIEKANIQSLRKKRVDNLSGGERQKAYLAMILAQNTRIIVLDEPTTFMDVEYSNIFLRILSELKTKHKKTLLVIMHDLSQAVRYADDIAVIDDKHVIFKGSSEECLNKGVIEKVFNVKSHIFYEDKEKYVFFE